MDAFSVVGKTVTLFPAGVPDAPLLCLNTFGQEGQQVLAAARAAGCPPFTLVAVSGLDWDHDMAPWDCPPVFRSSTPCTGGADDYLQLLTREILPRAEAQLPGPPRWRGIAGYSLAGLFALYALYRTDRFCCAASVSGSLWFPGFRAFVAAHQPLRRPDRLYFSLGDREHRTRSPLLQTVRQNTEELSAYYQGQGIPTVFQLNHGTHATQPAQRTAAGLQWLLRP